MVNTKQPGCAGRWKRARHEQRKWRQVNYGRSRPSTTDCRSYRTMVLHTVLAYTRTQLRTHKARGGGRTIRSAHLGLADHYTWVNSTWPKRDICHDLWGSAHSAHRQTARHQCTMRLTRPAHRAARSPPPGPDAAIGACSMDRAAKR